jgi:hypothetical protein
VLSDVVSSADVLTVSDDASLVDVVLVLLLPHAISDIAIAAQRLSDKSFFFINTFLLFMVVVIKWFYIQ